jgi:tetratricopeptide (TPR) repeat protein
MTQPTATGSLESTPFCELLVYALKQALSGSLVLECPDHTKHAILLQLGSPVKARVDAPETRLGELLVASGAIDPAARAAALAGAEGQLIGQRLFASGALDAASLARALHTQLLEQLAWLARAPHATAFAYYDQVDLLQHWGGEQLQLDALVGIWRAVSVGAREDRVVAACQGLEGKTLRLHPASRIGRFNFGAHERAMLDVLRVKPQSLSELEMTGLVEPSSLRKLLYALVLTRHLDTGAQPLGVALGARPPSAVAPRSAMPARGAARRSSAERPAVKPGPRLEKAPPVAPRDAMQTGRFLTREEIAAKHQQLEQQSFYELLEVERGASPEQIAEAFPALARRWHPDRLSPELGELRDPLTRVFARMTEASRILGQAATRAEYDRSLQSTIDQDAEQAQVVQVLRAAEAFQKAEILLKKRDLAGAERFAEVAHAGDKDQPEYSALYAWIRAQRVEPTEANLSESLGLLKLALSKQSNNVKIRYYLACVLKLAGQKAAALREFRFVAENDPSNLGAARELRLHDMRKGQPEPEPPGSVGIFGRFFKRGVD